MAKQSLASLSEALDGARMRIQAYEAKINAQEKRLEMLGKAHNVALAKVQAWKEVAFEALEQLKELRNEPETSYANDSDTE